MSGYLQRLGRRAAGLERSPVPRVPPGPGPWPARRAPAGAAAEERPNGPAPEAARPAAASPEHVSPALADSVAELMAELDPQAEIVLDLCCPACGGAFTAPFDAADYLFREDRKSVV